MINYCYPTSAITDQHTIELLLLFIYLLFTVLNCTDTFYCADTFAAAAAAAPNFSELCLYLFLLCAF